MKPTKSWGEIGAVRSVSRTWADPSSTWPFWPLWEKDDTTAEDTYSGTLEDMETLAATFEHEEEDELLTWYEFTLNTDTPATKLTVRRGTAHKLEENAQ